ncbi:hypothetical protein [Loigolactobacillus coryniformis]|uniref:hypothetical protein n=1 Tax=Loigolactobacillus coryniformis TaxID=1610 RepID=UPI002340D815|nr:hypothetical protein [Loigolactobacillus coryniformis]
MSPKLKIQPKHKLLQLASTTTAIAPASSWSQNQSDTTTNSDFITDTAVTGNIANTDTGTNVITN